MHQEKCTGPKRHFAGERAGVLSVFLLQDGIRYLHRCDIQNFHSRFMPLKCTYISALVTPSHKDKIIDESWI